MEPPRNTKRKRERKREQEPPLSVAQQNWINRVRSANGDYRVWMLSPKRAASPINIDSVFALHTIMWASSEAEHKAYMKNSLHPNDCEMMVLQQDNRSVYITWKSMDQSETKNINIPASRILLENNLIDPPVVEVNRKDLIRYTHCFPSDHVIFHQTINNKLVSYDKKQFLSDWGFMYPRNEKMAYKVLAQTRYQHFSQPLTEFEETATMNDFVKIIIEQYMGKQVGPSSHWDQAQLAVLGAAMLMMYQRDWHTSSDQPRISYVGRMLR
jgi:hypothetical protein